MESPWATCAVPSKSSMRLIISEVSQLPDTVDEFVKLGEDYWDAWEKQ